MTPRCDLGGAAHAPTASARAPATMTPAAWFAALARARATYSSSRRWSKPSSIVARRRAALAQDPAIDRCAQAAQRRYRALRHTVVRLPASEAEPRWPAGLRPCIVHPEIGSCAPRLRTLGE
jgi:hypothetical protein